MLSLNRMHAVTKTKRRLKYVVSIQHLGMAPTTLIMLYIVQRCKYTASALFLCFVAIYFKCILNLFPFVLNTFCEWFLPSDGAAKQGAAAPISPHSDETKLIPGAGIKTPSLAQSPCRKSPGSAELQLLVVLYPDLAVMPFAYFSLCFFPLLPNASP